MNNANTWTWCHYGGNAFVLVSEIPPWEIKQTLCEGNSHHYLIINTNKRLHETTSARKSMQVKNSTFLCSCHFYVHNCIWTSFSHSSLSAPVPTNITSKENTYGMSISEYFPSYWFNFTVTVPNLRINICVLKGSSPEDSFTCRKFP